jgi:hypothetical protein
MAAKAFEPAEGYTLGGAFGSKKQGDLICCGRHCARRGKMVFGQALTSNSACDLAQLGKLRPHM